MSSIECTMHAALTDNYSVRWMCESLLKPSQGEGHLNVVMQ